MIYKGQRRVNHPKSNICIGCGEAIALKAEYSTLLDKGYLCVSCCRHVEAAWRNGA